MGSPRANRETVGTLTASAVGIPGRQDFESGASATSATPERIPSVSQTEVRQTISIIGPKSWFASNEVIKYGPMPLSETDRKIAKAVIRRFLVDKESTQRLWVAREFRDVDTLQNLMNLGMVKTNTGDDFFPTALAFRYSGVPDYERVAKESVKIVASVLQDLFLTEPNQTDFTVANVEERAVKLHQNGESETIRLGLYLCNEFGWLAGWAAI